MNSGLRKQDGRYWIVNKAVSRTSPWDEWMQARIHVIAAAIIIILRALFLRHPHSTPNLNLTIFYPIFSRAAACRTASSPSLPLNTLSPLPCVVFAFVFRDPEETSSDCFGTCPTHTGTRMIYWAMLSVLRNTSQALIQFRNRNTGLSISYVRTHRF